MTDANPKPTTTVQVPSAPAMDLDILAGTSLTTTVNSAAVATKTPENVDGLLTYQNAHPDERELIDKVIASVDLTNSDTLTALGAEELEDIGKIADRVLDNIQPGVKVAFVQAAKSLLSAINANSLDEIQKRLTDGTVATAAHKLFNVFTGRDTKLSISQKTIEKFMTDVSGSRKIIAESSDKLQEQLVLLEQNNNNIKQLGAGLVVAVQNLQIVRAATQEYIRRVNAGEITVLTDLEKMAQTTGRADDLAKLHLARADWDNLQTKDATLLGAIGDFEVETTKQAFAQESNMKNRLDTLDRIKIIIPKWKLALASYADVLAEIDAADFLNSIDAMTKQQVNAGANEIQLLATVMGQRAGKGAIDLNQMAQIQAKVATIIEGVSTQAEEQYAELESSKESFAKSTAAFQKRITDAYTRKPGGLLSAYTAPKALSGGPK